MKRFCLFLGIFFIQMSLKAHNSEIEKKWVNLASIHQEMFAHPFIQEMVSGKLHPDKFLKYQQQDLFYLFHYAIALRKIATLTLFPFEIDYLCNIALHVENAIPALYEKYFQDYMDLQIFPECDYYISHLSFLKESENYYYSVGSLVSCIFSYAVIANEFFDQVNSTNPYYFWFIENRSDLNDVTQFIVHVLQRATDEEYQDFINGFMTALSFEAIFWDGGYNS